MLGELALDSNVAIRYLNGDHDVVARVSHLSVVILPTVVVGELVYGAENSAQRPANLARYYQFIDTCVVLPIGRETATLYAQTRLQLKRKGRPIPENDIWIAAQCIEHGWTLATFDAHFKYVDALVVDEG